jgi:hypothetical protein
LLILNKRIIMNAKQVLSKVVKLLNLEAEVELTYAKLADGTIVESATFDVGEELFVVSEDGTKTPAPNGTHELMLKDEEGNETLLKVITEDGKIVERENVELELEAEVKETEPLAGDPTAVNDVKDEKAAGEQVKDLKPSSMLSEVELGETPMEETETAETIPADDDKEEMGMPEMMKKIEDMAYRIEEMEKKITKMAEIEIEVKGEEKEMEDEELPKLDGAPIEEGFKFSSEQNNKRFGKKVDTPQNSFLSKLYK